MFRRRMYVKFLELERSTERDRAVLEQDLQETLDLCIGKYALDIQSTAGIGEKIFELERIALVFTDILDSTLMAAEDAVMYRWE
eukprot:9456458-Pyramimonas_sp.AAC.1